MNKIINYSVNGLALLLVLFFAWQISQPNFSCASDANDVCVQVDSPRVEIMAAAQFKPFDELPRAGDREPLRVLHAVVTAYSSTPDQTDDTPFITANGTHVRDGIVATNRFSFGTKVRFPDVFGDKVFTVEDRMHPRFNDRFDIWFETRAEAIQFGAQYLKVEIYPAE